MGRQRLALPGDKADGDPRPACTIHPPFRKAAWRAGRSQGSWARGEVEGSPLQSWRWPGLRLARRGDVTLAASRS